VHGTTWVTSRAEFARPQGTRCEITAFVFRGYPPAEGTDYRKWHRYAVASSPTIRVRVKPEAPGAPGLRTRLASWLGGGSAAAAQTENLPTAIPLSSVQRISTNPQGEQSTGTEPQIVEGNGPTNPNRHRSRWPWVVILLILTASLVALEYWRRLVSLAMGEVRRTFDAISNYLRDQVQ
jgi:hypothetical protein